MAFSSGCLLFTALFKILPESLNYFNQDKSKTKNANLFLILSYASGIIICLSFNAILHLVTSESVVHCDHEHTPIDEVDDIEAQSSHSHSHSHSEPVSYQLEQETHTHSHSEHIDETSSLLKRPSKSMLHLFSQENNDLGECKGYTSAELCLFHNNTEQDLHFCEIPELSEQVLSPIKTNASSHNHRGSVDHHHHHVTLPISRLFLIGIQTALAITLHKFPEGFITYVTSETNPELGITIFLSLLLHNFTEGFSICLPLYYSFESGMSKYPKLKAGLISGVLAGLSQPLGALVGWVFLRLNHINPSNGGIIDAKNLDFIFGIIMAITSGFLTVVGLSMYGSAVSFGGSVNFVMIWCVIGIILIGLSTAFT